MGTMIAFDRKTGAALWSTTSRAHAGYSSPMVATLAEKRQLLLFDGERLAGYELEDPNSKGKDLWRYPWETMQNINVAQPLVLEGDRLVVSSGYEVGCALLQVKRTGDSWKVEPMWKKKTLQCKFSSPVFYNGNIYGLNNKRLVCIDAQTGESRGQGEEYDFGQVLLAGDLLVVSGEDGQLALVEASSSLRELGQVQALKGQSWNPAAVSNGRVYWRNNKEMACFDLSGN
jgi:outer membrane protein assembly factor BamB